MHLWIFAGLFFLFLQACMQEDHSKPAVGLLDPSSSQTVAFQQALVNDTDRMHQVADDKIAGRNPPPVFKYKDLATRTEYQINTGWRIVPRQAAISNGGAPLAKAASGLMQTWTDASGQVETRIYECVTPTLAQHQSLGCQVEPGFILTGGGAYVDYGSGAGALLWESRPADNNLITWLASSKDHIVSSPHILHVYAYGMRLKANDGTYIAVSTLRGNYFRYLEYTSSPAVHWPVYGTSTSAETFLGAGARTNWSCCGSLLTSLKTTGAPIYSGLSVSGKDHVESDPSTITAYAICTWVDWQTHSSMSITIPNFGELGFSWKSIQGSSVGTGVAVAYGDADPGWNIIGPGGSAQWTSGPGRLLFGIKPTGTYSDQITVYSKDHRAISAGYNTVDFSEAKKW